MKKSPAILCISALSLMLAASASYATHQGAPHADEVIEEIDHNIMEGLDPNAIDDGASDLTIVSPPDPKTVGKPRPKPKKGKVPAKEIPLIELGYEGHSSDDVSYVTGGIGKDERTAIEASKADYNLYVLSASTSGEFVGDTRVVITRTGAAETEEVLNVESGPLLYVRLPAGSYKLVASLGDVTKEQTFTVNAKGKASTIRLNWKSVE